MKITRATLKSFIRKNEGKLYINVKSSFNGMVDCVTDLDGGFTKVEPDGRPDYPYTLGIKGLWTVGHSGDLFHEYENTQFKGIEIYNCCGTQVLAIRK